MIVEYATVLTAISLFAATLSGSYGQSLSKVVASDAAAVSTVASAARSQKVSPAGAKAAYARAPYAKRVLKYLYALGWIGGTKKWFQCRVTFVNQDAAKRQAEEDIRARPKLVTQIKKQRVSVGAAADALMKGVVSACS